MSDTTIDLTDVEKSAVGTGLGVSTFYNRDKATGTCQMMLRQRRVLINYKELADGTNPLDSDDPSSPTRLQRKRKGNISTQSFSDDSDEQNSVDKENGKPNRRSAKRSKMISNYEQMVLQNIEEKKQLLLKLNFLGQKKPDKPNREKRPKRIIVIQPSSRVLRVRQLMANTYNEQDIIQDD